MKKGNEPENQTDLRKEDREDQKKTDDDRLVVLQEIAYLIENVLKPYCEQELRPGYDALRRFNDDYNFLAVYELAGEIQEVRQRLKLLLSNRKLKLTELAGGIIEIREFIHRKIKILTTEKPSDEPIIAEQPKDLSLRQAIEARQRLVDGIRRLIREQVQQLIDRKDIQAVQKLTEPIRAGINIDSLNSLEKAVLREANNDENLLFELKFFSYKEKYEKIRCGQNLLTKKQTGEIDEDRQRSFYEWQEEKDRLLNRFNEGDRGLELLKELVAIEERGQQKFGEITLDPEILQQVKERLEQIGKDELKQSLPQKPQPGLFPKEGLSRLQNLGLSETRIRSRTLRTAQALIPVSWWQIITKWGIRKFDLRKKLKHSNPIISLPREVLAELRKELESFLQQKKSKNEFYPITGEPIPERFFKRRTVRPIEEGQLARLNTKDDLANKIQQETFNSVLEELRQYRIFKTDIADMTGYNYDIINTHSSAKELPSTLLDSLFDCIQKIKRGEWKADRCGKTGGELADSSVFRGLVCLLKMKDPKLYTDAYISAQLGISLPNFGFKYIYMRRKSEESKTLLPIGSIRKLEEMYESVIREEKMDLPDWAENAAALEAKCEEKGGLIEVIDVVSRIYGGAKKIKTAEIAGIMGIAESSLANYRSSNKREGGVPESLVPKLFLYIRRAENKE